MWKTFHTTTNPSKNLIIMVLPHMSYHELFGSPNSNINLFTMQRKVGVFFHQIIFMPKNLVAKYEHGKSDSCLDN